MYTVTAGWPTANRAHAAAASGRNRSPWENPGASDQYGCVTSAPEGAKSSRIR